MDKIVSPKTLSISDVGFGDLENLVSKNIESSVNKMVETVGKDLKQKLEFEFKKKNGVGEYYKKKILEYIQNAGIDYHIERHLRQMTPIYTMKNRKKNQRTTRKRFTLSDGWNKAKSSASKTASNVANVIANPISSTSSAISSASSAASSVASSASSAVNATIAGLDLNTVFAGPKERVEKAIQKKLTEKNLHKVFRHAFYKAFYKLTEPSENIIAARDNIVNKYFANQEQARKAILGERCNKRMARESQRKGKRKGI